MSWQRLQSKCIFTHFQPFSAKSMSSTGVFFFFFLHRGIRKGTLASLFSSCKSLLPPICHSSSWLYMKTWSKSLRLELKRKGTLIKLHFVRDLRRFSVLTPADRFERTWLRANSEEDEFFIWTRITSQVKVLEERDHMEREGNEIHVLCVISLQNCAVWGTPLHFPRRCLQSLRWGWCPLS